VPIVIGTLWKVDDAVPKEIAPRFYQKLDLAESIDNVSSAASQLHVVVGELRRRGADFVDWLCTPTSVSDAEICCINNDALPS
jgi:hypothetical protein